MNAEPGITGFCRRDVMNKALKGKAWTIVGFFIIFLIIVGIIALVRYFTPDTQFIESRDALVEGEYSVDGGEWKEFYGSESINERFQRIEIRWRAQPQDLIVFSNLNISAKNVWYNLSREDGFLILERKYESREMLRDKAYEFYKDTIDDPNDPYMDKEYFIKNFPIGYSLDMDMPDTPGYSVGIRHSGDLYDNDTTALLNMDQGPMMILTVENPYGEKMRFSECCQVLFSGENGFYFLFFKEALPAVMLFALVCFFGLFLFPIAGFILGKVDYRYLAFGALSFIWGLYMIGQRISGYLNLWVKDATACMAVIMLLKYCLMIAILLYLKVNLKRDRGRKFANLIATIYILAVIAAIILHFTFVWDLYASSDVMDIIMAICTLLMGGLLVTEAGESRQTVHVLIGMAPLAVSTLLDALKGFFDFADFHFYYFGLTVTMLYQLFRIILDLRQQYKDAIRYQKMQKELYEAKVGVMVSQIQPHFMYNALTSIAMLCSEDPDTAQEATVTFAKYLRGNMDSLKQTAPVPFEQELEHLKKYLYIEKLRFDEKLNIVYDIETTDFRLPQLSIQPLVENAVKHGVGMKKKGGTVTISTRETEEDYRVIISDDGVGFDMEEVRKKQETESDGKSHVGMENTRRRLQDMCDGRVEIESTPGEGTIATVILPKSGQEKSDGEDQ